MASRPDLPRIEETRHGSTHPWRLDYGSLRGLTHFATEQQAHAEMVRWCNEEIDQHILYLDELRRLRNRSAKRLKALEEAT